MAGSKGKGSRSGYQKRQRSSFEFIMSPFYEAPSEYDALVKDYRTLAKAADTRLKRLEKLGEDFEKGIESAQGYGHATDYAYRRAMHDIEMWSGEGATRYNRKPPESVARLKMKMQDIRTFLSMDTSTKSGLARVEEKRAATLNDLFKTNFTPKEIGKFFDSKLRKKMEDKVLDSDTMVKTIAVMRRNKDIILQTGVKREKKIQQITEAEKKRFEQQVKEANEKNVDAPDEMVEKLINTMLEKHNPSVRRYLKTVRGK